MSGFAAVTRKSLSESRWLLGLLSLALFGLSWLSVYRTSAAEAALREESERALRIRGFFQTVGGPAMDMSSGAIEALTLYWFFLLIPILLANVWAISRGSMLVAGELEKGSFDLVLSRPVSRLGFYFCQSVVEFIGLITLVAAIVFGNLFGNIWHHVESPPHLLAMIRPALNLAMVGFAIFGYTAFLSAIDLVRWRPLLFASAITLAQFVALAVANQPEWEEYRWLNHVTVFSAFAPVEAAVRGSDLPYNVSILGGIGIGGLILGLIVFLRRDLPASGG